MLNPRSESSSGDAQSSRVLVVEDEDAIRRGLCDVLVYHGFSPIEAATGDDGLALALEGDHALILLDIMLPGRSGFEVCTELRAAECETPILMLTARGSEEDILQGFRCGADDYVTKPFSVAELVARIEALMRRARRVDDAEEREVAGPVEFGPWHVDGSALCASKGEHEVELTRREVDLIYLLLEETGRIVSRRRLLRELWGFPDPDRVETRTVDMHIAKLRKKLSPEAASLIETVRGEGYRFSG